MSDATRAAAAERIRRVARDLGPSRELVVFIGGTVLPLLVNVDARFDSPRPTKDVDAVAATASYSQMGRLEAALRAAGFRNAPGRHAQRWRTPSGEFFDLSFAGAQTGGTGSPVDALAIETALVLDGDPPIRHVSGLGLFLMKTAAFADRGRDVPFESKDLADLAVLLCGRSTLEAEADAALTEVRAAMVSAAQSLLATADLVGALRDHFRDRRPIPPDTPADLAAEAIDLLQRLALR